MLIPNVHDLGDTGADHVIRERPKIAIVPNVAEQLTLGERYYHRGWERVGDKIDACNENQRKGFAEFGAAQKRGAIKA